MAQVTSQLSTPANVTAVDITSNTSSKTVSLVNGLVRLQYFESILQDSIKVSVIYTDTGNTIDGQSALEGLPLVGTEDVSVAFTDNNDVKLKVKLNVNEITPFYEDANKTIVSLSLVSEEYIRNEGSSSRLIHRYDGKISDHIESILKSGERSLKTKKKCHIESTSNDYNFLGNGRKPYYLLNWLSKNSVPEGGEMDSAGFLFFETSKGYHFKSIDKLFDQEKKKSFIYNESPDGEKGVPAGYDGKILEQKSDNSINAQAKFSIGAYNTKLVLFDPFNCKYEVVEKTAGEAKKVKHSGKALPKFNKKFDSEYTRTTYMLVDTGGLPTGKGEAKGTDSKDPQEQVKKNDQKNFEAAKTLNQAIRRYNQMFSAMMEITIAGDFSLHAGDVIYVDIPSVKASKDDSINKQSGGLYIIADLCHLVTPDGTWTKLNLARDSFGRKGNHTTR
tara:strand:- start:6491 stop:7828 length:1338 start_codon:yes stop_codon:yes gene_type:complete